MTVNNGSTSSNTGNRQVRTGRQLVTITPLPPGYHPPHVTHVQPGSQSKGASAALNFRPTSDPVVSNSKSHSVVTQRQGQKDVDSKLDKILLKAAYKGKKEFKTFTLRNVDTAAIASLKKLIKDSLRDDINSKDFDVGYMQGSNVIRVRT